MATAIKSTNFNGDVDYSKAAEAIRFGVQVAQDGLHLMWNRTPKLLRRKRKYENGIGVS